MKECEAAGGQPLDLGYFIHLLALANLATFTIVKHFYFLINSTIEYGVLQVRGSNRERQWAYINCRVYYS